MSYPLDIDVFREIENLPHITYDADKKTTLFAEDQRQITDAIVHIEQTLGINPLGGYSSVAERLDNMGGGGAPRTFDAVVGGGDGDYATLADALNNGAKSIFIRDGNYSVAADVGIYESNVYIEGESRNGTILSVANNKKIAAVGSGIEMNKISITSAFSSNGALSVEGADFVGTDLRVYSAGSSITGVKVLGASSIFSHCYFECTGNNSNAFLNFGNAYGGSCPVVTGCTIKFNSGNTGPCILVQQNGFLFNSNRVTIGNNNSGAQTFMRLLAKSNVTGNYFNSLQTQNQVGVLIDSDSVVACNSFSGFSTPIINNTSGSQVGLNL